jgi:hypothetical protein
MKIETLYVVAGIKRQDYFRQQKKTDKANVH